MYLMKTKMLADELKAGTLPEKEKFKYYALFIILYALRFNSSEYPEIVSETAYRIIDNSLNIALSFLSIYIPYLWNKKGDGKNFIERDICLSVPIGINILLSIFVLAFLLTFIFQLLKLWLIPQFSLDSFLATGLTLDIVSGIVVYGLLILYSKGWIRYVSGQNIDLVATKKSNFIQSAVIVIVCFLALFFIALAESKGAFSQLGGFNPYAEKIEDEHLNSPAEDIEKSIEM